MKEENYASYMRVKGLPFTKVWENMDEEEDDHWSSYPPWINDGTESILFDDGDWSVYVEAREYYFALFCPSNSEWNLDIVLFDYEDLM